tara:strand:- start:203 stop:718 length:516 start_codon:yes stop_codon:yes gene_type:complete
MPHLDDTVFSKSLIYLCQHDSKGAMGIIINKPMLMEDATQIISKIGLKQITPNIEIYFGGPVNIEMGLFLHDQSYNIDGTITISQSISLTTNRQILTDINKGIGPNEYRFSLGYTGWGRGQIEKEIENGDWLLIPSDDDLIFSIPNTDKWQMAATQFGVKISDMGGSAGIA